VCAGSAEIIRNSGDTSCEGSDHPLSESSAGHSHALHSCGCDHHHHITNKPLESSDAPIDQAHLNTHGEFRASVQTSSSEFLMPFFRLSLRQVHTRSEIQLLFKTILRSRDPVEVLTLVRKGINIKECDRRGNSALHVWARATAGGELLAEFGRLLIDATADVNAQRVADGMSPLHHVAAGYGRRRCKLDLHEAVLLVRNSSNLWHQTAFGAVPTDLLPSRMLNTMFLHSLATCPAGRANCQWCHR